MRVSFVSVINVYRIVKIKSCSSCYGVGNIQDSDKRGHLLLVNGS